MPLHPLKRCLRAVLLPLLQLRQYQLYQIPVLNRFPCRRPPVFLYPGHAPLGDALDGVLGVGEDKDFAVDWGNVDSAKDGG